MPKIWKEYDRFVFDGSKEIVFRMDTDWGINIKDFGETPAHFQNFTMICSNPKPS